jgi:hypothetical protein
MSTFRLSHGEAVVATPRGRAQTDDTASRNGALAMRVLFEWAGLIVLAAVIVVGGALFGLMQARERFDGESKAFAQASARAIAANWDQAALMSRASPELVAMPADQIGQMLDQVRRMGGASTIRDCSGGSTIALRGLRAPAVTAVYDCYVDVTGGQAVVDLAMRDDAGVWKIAGFHVSSPLLEPELQRPQP